MNEIGVIGLGVMGRNIALNMVSRGFKVAGFNRSFEKTKELIEQGIQNFEGFEHLEEFVASLSKPKKIFLMVPAGNAVGLVIDELLPHLSEGDIIMDGGNSFFEDTNRRYERLEELGIKYFGVGVSGGEEGALKGPSIMPSGDKAHYPYIAQILESIAAKKDGEPCCKYIGPKGSGHYVKMVHNGIEYADMQLLAEIYLIFKYIKKYSNQKIADIFEQWDQREVSSYLVRISADVLREKDHQSEEDLIDIIEDIAGNKGTGRWTSMEALKQEYNASLLSAAYQARVMSNQRSLRKAMQEPFANLQFELDDELIYQAYALSKSIAFAQGFGLYQDASERYHWNLNLKEIASIFRSGCIIQARLLQEIMDAYDSGATQLLTHEKFAAQVKDYKHSLQEVAIHALKLSLPTPVLLNALLYLNQLSSPALGANLIQGQRDYFGAHTYQRKGTEGFEHHDWNLNAR